MSSEAFLPEPTSTNMQSSLIPWNSEIRTKMKGLHSLPLTFTPLILLALLCQIVWSGILSISLEQHQKKMHAYFSLNNIGYDNSDFSVKDIVPFSSLYLPAYLALLHPTDEAKIKPVFMIVPQKFSLLPCNQTQISQNFFSPGWYLYRIEWLKMDWI